MASYFVDPSIDANSGAGTIGDPYGDLQWALDSETRNSTTGDIFNIKAGTAEVLAAPLNFTSYGTPASNAPVIFRGYATAEGDADFEAGTGIAEVDCNGESSMFSATSIIGLHLAELECHNVTGDLMNLRFGMVLRCELHNADRAIRKPNSGRVKIEGNHFHDISSECYHNTAAGDMVFDNYFETGSGSNDFTYAIYSTATIHAEGNIVYLASGHAAASSGIRLQGSGMMRHNSIFADNASTGLGLETTTTGTAGANLIEGNIVEGFDGSGGVGIGGDEFVSILAHNYVSGAATAYDVKEIYAVDNETSAISPFSKSGVASFSNRRTYFQPTDTGNIIGGLPSGRNKGAIHRKF